MKLEGERMDYIQELYWITRHDEEWLQAQDPEYEDACMRFRREKKYFAQSLNPAQQEGLEKVLEKMKGMGEWAARLQFKAGFCTGVRLLLEALQGERKI